MNDQEIQGLSKVVFDGHFQIFKKWESFDYDKEDVKQVFGRINNFDYNIYMNGGDNLVEIALVKQHGLVLTEQEIHDDETIFILDSGASINIFKSLKVIENFILLNLEENDQNGSTQKNLKNSISGIFGEPTTPTHKGYLQGLGKFWIVPEANHNLISLSMLMKLGLYYKMKLSDMELEIKLKGADESLLIAKINNQDLYVVNEQQILELSTLEQESQEAFEVSEETNKNVCEKSFSC
jgi:hypothetical protein